MGQKVNPNGLRIGINKDWQSRWIASDNKQTAKWLVEDDKIRTLLIKDNALAQISNVEIERNQHSISINAYSAQPGLLLGKEGETVNRIKKDINKIVGKKIKVNLNVITVNNPLFSARLVAREIADAIEKKVSFRNAQKIAIKKVLQAGAIGIKTKVSGRLGGVEMAREEGYSEGMIPLSTFRADIDYALEEAHTTYGIIGVKVWINRGEIFSKDEIKRFNPLLDSKKREFNNKRSPNNDKKTNDQKPRRNFANNNSERKPSARNNSERKPSARNNLGNKRVEKKG